MKIIRLISFFLLIAASTFPAAHSGEVQQIWSTAFCCGFIDISGDGQTVAGPFGGPTNSATPTYWTKASGLVVVPGRTGNFIGISRDGSTLAGTSISDNFRYQIGAGYIDLPSTGGQTELVGLGPRGISLDGSFITGAEPTGSQSMVRWNASGTATLISQGEGLDISDDGNTIVGKSPDNGTQATRWVWNSSTMNWDLTTVTTGNTNTNQAHAVSASGSIMYGQANNSAFRWDQTSGTVDLGTSFSGNSDLRATSEDGRLAVGSVRDTVFTNNETKAVVWDEDNGFRLLEDLMEDAGIDTTSLPNFNLAHAISDSGQYIVATRDAVGAPSEVRVYWIDLEDILLENESFDVPIPRVILVMLILAIIESYRRSRSKPNCA